jgi:hypothetical protein
MAIAARTQPRHCELNRTDPRAPPTHVILVALSTTTVRSALTELRAGKLRDLGLHDLAHHHTHAVAQHVQRSDANTALPASAGGQTLFRHRGVRLLVGGWSSDDHEHHGARNHRAPAELHH